MPESDVAVAVDLDGTLISTDILYESALKFIRASPLGLVFLILWLVQGRAFLKSRLAHEAIPHIQSLPYNKDLIEWLKSEKAKGRSIVLCTGSDIKIATRVADHLGLFDCIIASDGITNNVGLNKRKALEEQFGPKGYDYVGNCLADNPAWEGARNAIAINSRKVNSRILKKLGNLVQVIDQPRATTLEWMTIFRIHHWLKNSLLGVPLLTAGPLDNVALIGTLSLAFLSFGFCASAIYVINDLLDLEHDRLHQRKRHRAFASGKVEAKHGLILAPLLGIGGAISAAFVGFDFALCILAYSIIAIAYSMVFKRYAVVDCFVLAGLYTVRLMAGSAATGVPLSFWLMAFSGFLFLSLAFLKRFAELERQLTGGQIKIEGRGYFTADIPVILGLGLAAGYSSVLVFALYLNGGRVSNFADRNQLGWLGCVVILFWITHMWLQAQRGKMNDDPLIFAVKDRTSLSCLVVLCVYTVAQFHWHMPLS